MASRVPAIILAAGESKRMGQSKLLMPLGNKSIIEMTVDNYLTSDVIDVIIIVGNETDEIVSRIDSKGVKIRTNRDYYGGMGTSISAGMHSLDKDYDGVMIALGDQPFVDHLTINLLVEAFSVCTEGVVVPLFRGRRGHPIVFSKKYEDDLKALKGDVGGRQILESYPEDILEVTVDCEGTVIDIDTLDGYQSAVRLAGIERTRW